MAALSMHPEFSDPLFVIRNFLGWNNSGLVLAVRIAVSAIPASDRNANRSPCLG